LADDPRVAVAELKGQLTGLESTLKSAHKRIDKMEILIREDFHKIQETMEKMNNKLDEVNGYMNRGKGWAGAGLLLAGLIGGLVSKLAALLFSGK